ncbi:MAG: hypothetical protein Q9223_002403 [Gallowayella weberi]
MGFTDFLSDAGLSSKSANQAQAVTKKIWQCLSPGSQLEATVSRTESFRRWRADIDKLLGDPSKAYTTYGPEKSELTMNPKDAPKAAKADEEEDDDLFGSDDESEDEEAKKKREENLAAYKKKKEGKTKPAAKSIVTLDVKPWDDETDMKQLEQNMRAIEVEGLVWGASKLVPVGFGIKKLQVNLVVEDEKVSIDDLQEQIALDEDHVQSSDVAAMQKL